jgi:hypothetical protein
MSRVRICNLVHTESYRDQQAKESVIFGKYLILTQPWYSMVWVLFGNIYIKLAKMCLRGLNLGEYALGYINILNSVWLFIDLLMCISILFFGLFASPKRLLHLLAR